MEENVKQAMQIILHERMKTKAKLEFFRFLEEADIKKSYQREINECLDRIRGLDEIYEKLKNGN